MCIKFRTKFSQSKKVSVIDWFLFSLSIDDALMIFNDFANLLSIKTLEQWAIKTDFRHPVCAKWEAIQKYVIG